MKKCKKVWRKFLSLCAVAALVVALAGCVSNKTNIASSVGETNLYFGTSSRIGIPPYWSGGVWSTTLDSATSYFGYSSINSSEASTAGSVPLAGAFTTTSNGFLDLTLSQGAMDETISYGGTGVGGYAVILPNEGLLMRTGDSLTDVYGHSSSALISAVSSATCPAFTSPETFNFIAQGTTNVGDATVHVAYGSIQVAQSGADSWSFSNFTMYDLNGNFLNPSSIPAATCPATLEGFILASPLPTPTDVEYVYTPMQITTGISPSGLLVIDEGQASYGTISNFDSTPTGPVGRMGVLKPSASLNVSDMVGKKYAGFESDPLGPLGTIAVVFGTTPGSGTTITGGGFPKDDVTQTPASDTTLDLGTQSTQTPGLFTSVTLTRPDTYAVCAETASGGKDTNGNPICIFHGAAVAGQVGGKYVIFTNINNPTAVDPNFKLATPLAVINIALYRQ